MLLRPFLTEITHPCYMGYTLLRRDGKVEVWHFASDRLCHVNNNLWGAVCWASSNSALPKSDSANIGKNNLTWADVEARAEPAATLAHENRPARHDVTVVPLGAEALRVAVAPVP